MNEPEPIAPILARVLHQIAHTFPNTQLVAPARFAGRLVMAFRADCERCASSGTGGVGGKLLGKVGGDAA